MYRDKRLNNFKHDKLVRKRKSSKRSRRYPENITSLKNRRRISKIENRKEKKERRCKKWNDQKLNIKY